LVNGPAQAGVAADRLPKGQIDVTIDTLFSSITLPLVRGEKVELRGFRSFCVCRPREFRAPKPAEPWESR
jgi:nucleoid DNA-binding protein